MRPVPLLLCLVLASVPWPARAEDSAPRFIRPLDLPLLPLPDTDTPVDCRHGRPAGPLRCADEARPVPDNRLVPGRDTGPADWLHLNPPPDRSRLEMEQAARRGHYDPSYWPARPHCRLCLICHRFGRQRAPCGVGP